MASDIWSLVLNVVASFIYAGIMYLWGMRGRRPISEPISNQNNTAVDAIELAEPVGSMGTGRRLKTRKNADETAYKFIFYLMTFGMLYLSISTPPVFKALFSNGEVFLSSARFIGEYLPAIPVGKTTLQFTFFLISALLYLPLLLVSEFVSGLIRPLVDSFKEVTERIFLAITMLVSVVLCIPLAAASVWLYFDKTYTDSLLSVLFFTAIPFIFLQAQSESR